MFLARRRAGGQPANLSRCRAAIAVNRARGGGASDGGGIDIAHAGVDRPRRRRSGGGSRNLPAASHQSCRGARRAGTAAFVGRRAAARGIGSSQRLDLHRYGEPIDYRHVVPIGRRARTVHRRFELGRGGLPSDPCRAGDARVAIPGRTRGHAGTACRRSALPVSAADACASVVAARVAYGSYVRYRTTSAPRSTRAFELRIGASGASENRTAPLYGLCRGTCGRGRRGQTEQGGVRA